MYRNILSLKNSINSSITYHTLSIKLRFMISPEIFTIQQITIAYCKDYESTGEWAFPVYIKLVSCVALYVATSVCWLCMQLTQSVLVVCTQFLFIVLYNFLCTSLQFCIVCVQFSLQFKYEVLQTSVCVCVCVFVCVSAPEAVNNQRRDMV